MSPPRVHWVAWLIAILFLAVGCYAWLAPTTSHPYDRCDAPLQQTECGR